MSEWNILKDNPDNLPEEYTAVDAVYFNNTKQVKYKVIRAYVNTDKQWRPWSLFPTIDSFIITNKVVAWSPSKELPEEYK